MIIHDFNVLSVAVFPGKANSKLIVDADTVLPFSVAREGFQVRAMEYRQVLKGLRLVEHSQFALRRSFDGPILP